MAEDAPPPRRRLSFLREHIRWIEQCLLKVLRSLIDRIGLHPRDSGKGVDAELRGALAEILVFCDEADRAGKFPKTGVSGSQLSVVAGTGFVQERTRCELRKTV